VAVRRPKDALALAWTTVWRDAEAAKVFRNVLEMQKPCWNEQTIAAGPGELFVSDDVLVESEGTRVVLVRGVPRSEARAIARRALRFDATPAKDAAPFALPQAPVVADQRDEFMMGTFTSSRLGLSAKVPDEFSPLHLNVADFAVASPTRGALCAISFVPEAPTEESQRDLFSAYVGDVADWPGGLVPDLPSAGTLWGHESTEQVWMAPSGAFHLRLSIVPACNGRAYFAVVRAGRRSSVAEDAMREWMNGIERKQGEPPACADL
jgi:hypothetical protein